MNKDELFDFYINDILVGLIIKDVLVYGFRFVMYISIWMLVFFLWDSIVKVYYMYLKISIK